MFIVFSMYTLKEVQIVYMLFLVNCYLLHIPMLPSQTASNVRGWVIEKNWLELAWQYIAMTRNNLSIIWISLKRTCVNKQYYLLNPCFLMVLLAIPSNKIPWFVSRIFIFFGNSAYPCVVGPLTLSVLVLRTVEMA